MRRYVQFGYAHDILKVSATPAPEQADPPSRPRDVPATPAQIASRKIGRNERCPCGSGEKFKRCCQLLPAARQPRLTRGRLA